MDALTVPASKDVSPEALADLLWSTDPKLNAYMFGTMPTLHRLIESEWSSASGLFSFKQAFTTLFSDEIVGLLIGFSDEEYAACFNASMRNQPKALGGQEAAHIEAALHWMDRLFPVPRTGSFYILEFAVSPQAQGLGIAGRLFNAAKDRAIGLGCQQICLDVAADNEAVGFYRHLGFQTEVETRVPVLDDNHEIGLHLHMVCDISDDT
ncbi:GNAT family N-acetyltransferase [uncultured Shimia sp.]|uniref:GNAT family N-acetyltransferase n=1 Tax=uncultured Shimia sp. TaxID=573152 RepID=UPI00261D0180|nr:GNAT family N-acetyltransferase [uncultured Shimia sp.]